MVAKLIVHGVDREHARRRMLRALDEFEIGGVKTLLGFHRALLSHRVLHRAATRATGSSSRSRSRSRRRELTPARRPRAAGGAAVDRVSLVEVDGRRTEVRVVEPEPPWRELARRRRERGSRGLGGGRDVS